MFSPYFRSITIRQPINQNPSLIIVFIKSDVVHLEFEPGLLGSTMKMDYYRHLLCSYGETENQVNDPGAHISAKVIFF